MPNLGKQLLANATGVWIALVTLVIIYYIGQKYGGPAAGLFRQAQRLATPGSN